MALINAPVKCISGSKGLTFSWSTYKSSFFFISVFGINGNVLAVGRAAGVASGGRDQGLPCVRYNQYLQNRPTAGHSWAHQLSWWHLCENICKKGQKTPEADKEGTKE